MRNQNIRNEERGMALLIALLALLLISAVGLGMMYMSSTETSINGNYRDTQVAFFAMRGGLEEMRDRMRSNSLAPIATAPNALPTTLPGAANSIVYITNPAGAGDVVNPILAGNIYFDDELCHETVIGMTNRPQTTKCLSTDVPAAGAVQPFIASVSPNTNTAAALKYKWVRITEKANGTFPNALVDSTQAAGVQVCWNATTYQEVVATALGWPDCPTAQFNGLNVAPVYVVTSLAITPQGSRRVGQYDTAAFNIAPPPSGLSLDGPAPIFGTPHSANGGINGANGSISASGTVPPATPGGCVPDPAVSVPAIGADNSVDAASLPPQIFRPGNFTGQGAPATPSVYDQGSDAGGSNQLTNWSTPTQLNNMVSAMANAADQSFNCGIGGGGCTGSYGTPAAPQITYINGDVNLTGGAGVLVVTGTLNISGAMQWDGLILVIGQGVVTIGGGGAGEIFGQVFIAKTNSSVSPYPQLATLGSPSFSWSGGGKATINYNSCWAGVGNTMHYLVVASREEMY